MKKKTILQTIVTCARIKTRARIKYVKLTGRIVYRNVAFYSRRGDFLYGTDNKHGNGKIRSYAISRILHAKITGHIFKPEWEIEL